MKNLEINFTIKYYLKKINTHGNIVYEYNPLRNYRLSEDEIDETTHSIKIPEGTIVDLDSDKLNFSLEHPVDILVQPSYDGSVNLIVNDNYNIPRLINSRFSVKQNNTYEIVDRTGDNDSNLYNSEEFNLDTSLYKRISVIPKIIFKGMSNNGNLKVGNYIFYFKYSDADGNESDFVAESGIVSCFMGNNKSPKSIQGGIRDENSGKSVKFLLQNIDESYEYVNVYYTRSSSGEHEHKFTNAFKIIQRFSVINKECSITIYGTENVEVLPISEINKNYFIINKAKTQAICQNRLFLGNVSKDSVDNSDLIDISLRILPFLQKNKTDTFIGNCGHDYYDDSSNYEYYNYYNIYNKVGYWDEEIYRLGVVYIMNDGSLSSVYNIRGIDCLPTLDNINIYKSNSKLTQDREKISYNEDTFLINGGNEPLYENSKGVVRIKDSDESENFEKVYGIGIAVPKEVCEYLKGKVLGMFFVRQKRIPNILAQFFALPVDSLSGIPLLKRVGKETGSSDIKYYAESFIDSNRKLTGYDARLYEITNYPEKPTSLCGICPDYFLNQELFNQFFTGADYKIRKTKLQPSTNNLLVNTQECNFHYYTDPNLIRINSNDRPFIDAKIVSVTDGSPLVQAGNSIFRSKAGYAEEAFKFTYVGTEPSSESDKKTCTNLVRGIYSAYLGIDVDSTTLTSNTLIQPICMYNIYQSSYDENDIINLFKIRFEDNSPYYSISPRISLDLLQSTFNTKVVNNTDIFYYKSFYKGDCFIGNFTHRLNRNFQDPTSPTNNVIVDVDTWSTNYDPAVPENYIKINRGDINAVNLGSWITTKYHSNYNISIRSVDHTNLTEEALFGLPRSFYPLQKMDASGEYKIADSTVTNRGIYTTQGEQVNFILPEVPYVKNTFNNRIVYSDIAITDAFKNGFRSFGFNNFRDYPSKYGSIIKLEEWQGSLICICEHGILLIPVNERTVAGDGAGGNVFINTSNVLPENPRVLSDMFGTQWGESVLKTPYYIYGVDTVAKKIWRTDGRQVETISDFCIQKFLNDNLTLTERETTPIIGIRNVKTHYNAFKKDVMFTFYDNLHGFEEKVWNLCWNEVMQKWITFYSWLPSYSANIDNIFFSYNRDTSKWIAKLGTSKDNNSFSDGVVLSNNVIKDNLFNSELNLVNRSIPEKVDYYIEYVLEKDPMGFYKNFTIDKEKNDPNNPNKITKSTLKLNVSNINTLKTFLYWMNYKNTKVRVLYENHPNMQYHWMLVNENNKLVAKTNVLEDFEPDLTIYKNKLGQKEWLPKNYQINADHIVQLLNIRAIIHIIDTSDPTYNDYITSYNNYTTINAGYYESVVAVIPEFNKQYLTTDFWKHGFAGNIDISEKIKPTYWYGKQHPFEFEVVVADHPDTHKLFDNLQIISNNSEPESFHYEIVGDSFDLAEDKTNMYIRQEFTKDLYQANETDITYDRKSFELTPSKNNKSYLFPLYYERQDTYNDIEDYYHSKIVKEKDYSNLAGSELKYLETENQFDIVTHAKAVDIKKKGRLRGNMQYKEDKWDIQINPIVIKSINEADWETNYPDIIIGNTNIGNPLKVVPKDLLNLGYSLNPIKGIKDEEWKNRKELKQKDKFIKIRVRYSGEKLTTIMALKTLYSISYA